MKTTPLPRILMRSLCRAALSAFALFTVSSMAQAQPRLYSWGYNSYQQLGDGTSTSRAVPGAVKAPPDTSALGSVRSIAASDSFTVAARTDGSVYAWGINSYGQLGDGTTNSSLKPMKVKGPGGVGFLSDVNSVAASQYTTFALKTDGTLWGWGYNGYGNIGDNTTTNRTTPVQVHGPGNVGFLTNVTQVSAGVYHTLVVRSDGTLWGWGYNGSGELGDSNVNTRYVPTQVRGPNGNGFLTGVASIAAGLNFTIVAKTDGTVWAFGSNTYNQLGDGTTTARNTPTQVKGPGGNGFLTDVIAVTASEWHALALKSDGTVWGWGWNAYGQVGDGTTTQRSTPSQVKGPGNVGFLSNIRSLAASYYFTLALGQDGSVYGWGYNGYGQFGDNSTTGSYVPVQMHGPGNVGLLTEAAAIGIGDHHSAVLRADGTVWTSGYNYYGQLGNDTTTNSSLPIRVVGPEGLDLFPDAQSVVSRGNHTVVLKTNGTVYTFGYNAYGQLGDGTTVNRSIATQVKGPGGNGFLTDVIAVSAADWSTVALKSDGTVWAWGWNGGGLLGDGTTIQRNSPVQVKGVGGNGFLTNIIAIAAGPYHTLALHRNGTVYAWGSNNGQLGTGNSVSSTTPVQMRNADNSRPLSGIVGIAAGLQYSLMLGANGGIFACGANHYGQLGDGTTTGRLLPVRTLGVGGVGLLDSMVSVTASNYFSVALTFDGKVVAWGYNNVGQLGDGTTTDSPVPVRVVGPGAAGLLSDVASIATGSLHNLAVKFDGTVYSWGYNAHGQLGDNTTTNRPTPVQVKGAGGSGVLTNIIAISAADSHSVVISGEGTIQGNVILQSAVCSGIPLIFEFRPVNGTPFTRTVIAGPLGLFSFTNVPPGEYDISVKGSKWLRRTVHVNTAANNILNMRIFLLAGDANDDNAVDVFDLDALIQAFDAAPGDPNWNNGIADLNCDELVDVFDLDLLIQNFDLLGDL